MSQPVFWWFLFAALCAAIVTLPLLPAWREWRQPSDVAPLAVVREHGGQADAFAAALRSRLQAHQAALAAIRGSDARIEIAADRGGSVLLLGGEAVVPPRLEAGIAPDCIVAAAGNVALPPGSMLRNDLYAGGSIAVGAGSLLRAVLGEGRVELAAEVSVMRWAHAEDELAAAGNCRLHGRASAGRMIALAAGTSFRRLHAPHIRIGTGAADAAPPAELPVFDPGGEALDTAGRTRLLAGDLAVPPGHVLEVDVVVRGDLGIGADCLVRGSVKSGRRLAVGEGARIGGAAICSGNTVIAPGAAVGGPLVAEGHLSIGDGCRVGAPGRTTSASAGSIAVVGNVSVFGTLWARDEGHTMDIEA